METIIAMLALFAIDIIGFVFKMQHDEEFRKFKWRKIPFIWAIYN